MKKRLVRADNVDDFICREHGQFVLCDDMIVTPGARDELRRRNIGQVRASALAEKAPSGVVNTAGASPMELEELVRSLAEALHRECGVSDPEKLKAMTLQALKTIKANI